MLTQILRVCGHMHVGKYSLSVAYTEQMVAGLLSPLPEQSSTGNCWCPHLPVGHFHPTHPVLHTRISPCSSFSPAPHDPVEKDHPCTEAASASDPSAQDAQRSDLRQFCSLSDVAISACCETLCAEDCLQDLVYASAMPGSTCKK